MGNTYLVACSGLENSWRDLMVATGLNVTTDTRSEFERARDAGVTELMSKCGDEIHESIHNHPAFLCGANGQTVRVRCIFDPVIKHYRFSISYLSPADSRRESCRELAKRIDTVLRENGAEKFDPF